MKGADTVMSSIVQYNDWLNEEVDNMAREGLRYNAAKLSVINRGPQVGKDDDNDLGHDYNDCDDDDDVHRS